MEIWAKRMGKLLGGSQQLPSTCIKCARLRGARLLLLPVLHFPNCSCNFFLLVWGGQREVILLSGVALLSHITFFPPTTQRWSPSFSRVNFTFSSALLPPSSGTFTKQSGWLLPSHFIKFILYPQGVSLLSYMCQDQARTVGFELQIWKEVVLHIREHQWERSRHSRCFLEQRETRPHLLRTPVLYPG